MLKKTIEILNGNIRHMRYKHDIISIGDAMIDTFLFIHDLQVIQSGGQAKAMINWGDKLPVDKLYKTVAGNSANSAVGASRLGMKSAYYTVLAHDVGGREIIHKMKKEKVATEYIVIDDKRGTNASFVLSYKGERTIFVYHEPRNYQLPKFSPSKWVYLTSIRDGFKKIYPGLALYIKKTGARLAFNPGTYQLRAGISANKSMLVLADVLSLNREEAQGWVGRVHDIEELCKRLIRLGPKAIALTDGRKGAYSYSKEGFFYIPEFPGPRLDATGAGDSFTTAYVAALYYGKSHAKALAWGPVNAGSVVQKIGPQEGLLTRSQLESRLKKLPGFTAIPITDKKSKDKVAKMVARKKD